jgi:hypothetical protein
VKITLACVLACCAACSSTTEPSVSSITFSGTITSRTPFGLLATESSAVITVTEAGVDTSGVDTPTCTKAEFVVDTTESVYRGGHLVKNASLPLGLEVTVYQSPGPVLTSCPIIASADKVVITSP